MTAGEPVAEGKTLAGHLEELADPGQNTVGQSRPATTCRGPVRRGDPQCRGGQGECNEAGGQPASNRPAQSRGQAPPDDQRQRPAQRPEPGAVDLAAKRILALAAEAS